MEDNSEKDWIVKFKIQNHTFIRFGGLHLLGLVVMTGEN